MGEHLEQLREQVVGENPPSLRTFKRFKVFHEQNPHVVTHLVRLARQARAAGHHQYGIAALFEVLRWEMTVVTTGEAYKMCNDYKPFYARLIAIMHMDLDGFFVQHRLFECPKGDGNGGS